MQVKIVLDEETSNILRSIDKSLALLANREPAKTPQVKTGYVPGKKAGIERLTVASPEVLAKYAIVDKLREQGVDIPDEDIL